MHYRVLYLCGSAGRGGVETFLRSVAEHHASAAFEPAFFLFRPGPLGEALAGTGSPVFEARAHFRLRDPFSYFRLVAEIRECIRELKIDIVHSSMAYAALAGSLAARLEGARHVWFQHGPVGGWMDFLAGNLPYDLLFANSRFTLAAQERLWSWQSRKKHRVVPLGTEVPELGEPRRAKPARAVMLCRAQRWKGADIFARAVAELRSRNVPVEAEVYLAGDDREVWFELEEINSLRIHAEVPQAGPVLAAVDILVNASRTPEPFGLTLIEAMARGVVPVAPRAGGPLEILEDGVDGLLFTPGDSRELAAKLQLLLENPSRYQELRRRAHASAREKFSVELMVARLEGIYREILPSRPRAMAGQESSRS